MPEDRNHHERKAKICHELAAADDGRREHWLEIAEHWKQQPSFSRNREIVTHEVHQGRMIAKPAQPPARAKTERGRE